MVEYPAPGRIGQPDAIAQDGQHDAHRHADHVACMLDVCIAVILIRTRAIILERERHTAWVGQLQGATLMNWTSLSNFLDMGGYGLYVWGSYLVSSPASRGKSFWCSTVSELCSSISV